VLSAFKYHPGKHEAHVVAEATVLHSFGPTSHVSAAAPLALNFWLDLHSTPYLEATASKFVAEAWGVSKLTMV
jgi:hypothetical protein